MPELERDIEKRKAEILSGDRFPTWESRDCEEFRQKVRKACDATIEATEPGVDRRRLEGTEEERIQYLDKVLYPNVSALWFTGCAAPTVR